MVSRPHPMQHYWQKVFSRAWADTRSSFGFNQKTIGSTIIIIVGALFAYMYTGSVPDDVPKSLWYGLSFCVAGLALFGWNFAMAQQAIFMEQVAKIASLEEVIARKSSPAVVGRVRIAFAHGRAFSDEQPKGVVHIESFEDETVMIELNQSIDPGTYVVREENIATPLQIVERSARRVRFRLKPPDDSHVKIVVIEGTLAL